MADLKLSRDLALQTLKNPPPVASKLAALDALDRLALNPSGWLSDSVLDQLTEGRKAIITDRWGRALEALENTRRTLEGFVATLRTAAEAEGASTERKAALERASKQIESFVRSSGRDLQFRVDDESGRVIVSVRDSATGELIRQIPNEETLRIAQALEQRDSKALNLLIDDKA